MFPPTYWCLPKPFRPIRSSRIFLQLRRWMWTLRFVRSCYQGSSRMRHLLFRWKGRLYGNLRKGQGCLHLLWSPLNHSFLKIENKTIWRKEKFYATYFSYKNGNFKSSMKMNLFVHICSYLIRCRKSYSIRLDSLMLIHRGTLSHNL